MTSLQNKLEAFGSGLATAVLPPAPKPDPEPEPEPSQEPAAEPIEMRGTVSAAAEEPEEESPEVYHYFRPQMNPPFVIWAEDGEEGSFEANNRKAEQQIHGTTDYFTKKEYDPVVDRIQAYFNTLDHFGWTLQMVDYEDETQTIHFEWEWWML